MPHERLIRKLKRFYRQNGIGAQAFDCPHRNDCGKGCRRFVEAREPHIGIKYGKGIPRLAFVSLDPGSACSEVKYRVIERRDDWTPGEWVANGRDKARHWYRTHEIAQILLSPFDPRIESLPVENVTPYFAHLNSARCCQNKPNRKAADRKLFDNCRKFLAPEVEIFAPDILVTQGNWAWKAIHGNIQCLREFSPGHVLKEDWCWILSIDDKPALWFHTYHPRSYGNFKWQWDKVVRPRDQMARIACDFVHRNGKFRNLRD